MTIPRSISALHVMRTYGEHGGEQQLSQLFGANHSFNVTETFAFVFKDEKCAALFQERAPKLKQFELWPKRQTVCSAWCELFKLLLVLPLIQWRYFQLVSRLQPDVCLAHGFQAALVVWPTAFLSQKVGYAYVHRITKKRTRLKWVFRLIYFPFKLIVGNSIAVTQSLATYASLRKLVAIQNGVDIEKFDQCRDQWVFRGDSSTDIDVVIVVGRLLEYKGQELLIQAIAFLITSYPRLRLWVVGDGPLRRTLENQARSLGIQKYVLFLGQRSDVHSLLGQARLFANASSWEGMSNAVLEGMASGLPSVVADAPGVSECHIHGVTGLVVDRNPRALAAGIARLLDDPESALRMAKAARERLEANYSISANRAKYDFLYSCLASRLTESRY